MKTNFSSVNGRSGSLPVGEWGDDKAWGVPKVLIRIPKLCITDVYKAVTLIFIPPTREKGVLVIPFASVSLRYTLPVPELAEPDKCLGIVHFLLDEFCHHVSGVDVNGTDGHDPLPVPLVHVPQEKVDEDV